MGIAGLHLAADDVGIDERLQVVVGMFVDVVGLEDGIDVGQRLQAFAARLVVDHSDVLVVDEVESVDATADGGGLELTIERALDVALEAEDGEGCQAAVDGDELTEVVDDDLAIDEVQSALWRKGHHLVERLVNGAPDFNL